MESTDREDEAALQARIADLCARYGAGTDGSAPTASQWRRVLERPATSAITLINFFRLRDRAEYDVALDAADMAESGGEAMMRYATVSGPALERVGGRFLLTAPFETTLMGEDDAWDLVAIGSYPSRDALLALFDDRAYAAAFAHRRAAVLKQRVVAVQG